jgi:hypothetical protein
MVSPLGKFHDQGGAIWIVIRGQLRGHKDTPFERPTSGRTLGVFGGLSYYELVMLFLGAKSTSIRDCVRRLVGPHNAITWKREYVET